MARWFRFYADAMRNPKVARLSDKDYRIWTELLAMAAENDGRIPPLEDLKHLLKRRLDHLSSSVDRLITGRLIVPLGDGYAPHGWEERQYKSDTSTERVRKHRRSGNVSDAVTETPPDTDTETDVSVAKATAASGDPDKVFWDSAKGYLGPSKGGLIGKLAGEYGREALAGAITISMLQRPQPPDRAAYVIGILKRKEPVRPLVPL